MITRINCEEVFLKTWFCKTLKNGDIILRSWLLYSKLQCGLYCFCCKLFRLGNDHSLFVAKASITFLNLLGLGLAQPTAFLVYWQKRENNLFFAKRLGVQLWSSISVNCLNVDKLMVIFFLDTLSICISPSLISSFLFAFRFPVIPFENFCLAVDRLGSWAMVTSVIPTPAHYKCCLVENTNCWVNATKSFFTFMFLDLLLPYNLFFWFGNSPTYGFLFIIVVTCSNTLLISSCCSYYQLQLWVGHSRHDFRGG